MRWIALFLIIIIPIPTNAEINKRNLWIALGILPVAYFHETTLHEAAHVMVAKLAIPGLEVTKFAPYPCRDSKGNFHFGCFSSIYPDHIRVGDNTRNAIDIAPYALGISAFVVSDILLSTKTVKPKEPGGVILYMLGMFAPFIDFTMNFVFNRGDWSDIRNQTRHPAFDVVGSVFLIVGTYRLVKQGFEVFRR
jgi:hypothetical protein